MRIDLLHPGPVRHRPPRCRDARTAYVPMVTRVELRELSLSDADGKVAMLEHSGRHRTVVTLIDGEPWRAVGDTWRMGGRGLHRHVRKRDPIGAAAFRDWLEGRALDLDRRDFGRCLAGTP